MNGCHSCIHAADVINGRYARTPWHRIPCASCELYQDGQRNVEPVNEGVLAAAEAPDPDDGGGNGLRVLEDFARVFLTLPDWARDLVCRRALKQPYVEIAADLGMTWRGVEKRARMIRERWPAMGRYM